MHTIDSLLSAQKLGKIVPIIAKKDKIIAQLWYDSHSKDENYVYKFDQDLKDFIEVSK